MIGSHYSPIVLYLGAGAAAAPHPPTIGWWLTVTTLAEPAANGRLDIYRVHEASTDVQLVEALGLKVPLDLVHRRHRVVCLKKLTVYRRPEQ